MKKNHTYEQIKVSELKGYEKNARIHSAEQIQQVVNSIKEFGFTNPVLIDEENILIAGHGRTEAAKILGLEKVPAIRLNGLSRSQKKALRIADNQLALNATWDEDLLAAELEEIHLENFDLDLLGFDDEFLENLLDLETEEKEVIQDRVPDKEAERDKRVNVGDIWQLGRHRLICGDCTDKKTIEKLMNGKKADLVFTDPPYGMKKEKDGVLNDNLNFENLLEFNKQWIPITFENTKENGSWYCFGIDEPLMDIYSEILKPMIKEKKITFRNYITWFKGNGNGQRVESQNMYARASEKLLFVMCGVQGFNNNKEFYNEAFEGIREYLESEAKRVKLTSKLLTEITGVQMYSHWFSKSQFTIIPKVHYLKLKEYYNGQAFCLEYDELKNLLNKKEYKENHKTLSAAVVENRAYFDNTHDSMSDVWIYKTNPFGKTRNEFLKEVADAGGHATPKPLFICERAIKSSSREGEIVLDVFGGSGSTLITCEQINRTCFMSELSPDWCDVILERWENLTGKKAVKLKGLDK